jgi:SAM-dependent methyltransferase
MRSQPWNLGAHTVRDSAMTQQLRLPSKNPGEELVEKSPDYAPPPSVWYGEDAELLELLLDFYPREPPKRILDATVNGGRFWRGSTRPLVGMDIDSRYGPTLVADNTNMPFRDGCFDVVVYDPPHIPNQGKDRTKDFNTRFGLVLRSHKENHYTFTHTFPPFLREAYRVLKPEGVLLCKITDYVHNHRYQWAHIDLINAARETAFLPCDYIVKVRKSPIIDPKWKVAHHSRRQHCFWLVFRKSHKCE